MSREHAGRRELIVGAVIDLLAEHGVRALTHRAVDVQLGLSAGSTSYYFRTKAALYEATVAELASRARADFVAGRRTVPETLDVDVAAREIAKLVDDTLATRRNETLARYALTLELARSEELRPLLATSVFSVQAARSLAKLLGCDRPMAVARGLVSLVEGIVFERTVGTRSVSGPAPGTTRSRSEIASVVRSYLQGST